jgi:RNA polymerase sigma-70 factor, ECF subfamily
VDAVHGVRRGSHAAIEERPEAGVSDVILVTAAQADRAVFAFLFDRYWDPIFRFCYHRLGDWAEAEDAASQVFANALAALSRFRAGETVDTVRPWLFSIAYRVVANIHRRHARHPTQPLETATGRADRAPSPEELALAADDHLRLHMLLAQLPAEQRELLELRLAGLNAVEIAQVLGRSHDAIRKAESRAVGTLRELSSVRTAISGAKEAADD